MTGERGTFTRTVSGTAGWMSSPRGTRELPPDAVEELKRDGVKVPFTVRTAAVDPRDGSTQRFSSIEQNVSIDPKKFSMPEGTKLMLTHYCSMGNQPRMRVEKASKDGSTLTFSYVDATNLSSPKDTHMSGLVVTFKDDDHFLQQWIMSMNGKKQQHETFEFERVK